MNSKEDSLDFPFTANLLISSANKQEIKAVFDAIYPETKVDINQRGKAKIEKIGHEQLRMIFLAQDFISLRAMMSSYLRWIEAAFSSLDIIEEK
jgi:tRNA threonylcarbamoyladenosine modification (KEOPS) complex  Pcc1 subunit